MPCPPRADWQALISLPDSYMTNKIISPSHAPRLLPPLAGNDFDAWPSLASKLPPPQTIRIPEGIFRANLRQLESCYLPAPVAQSIIKKESFPRAEEELLAIKAIPNCTLINWSDPEYPQTLLQIYDPPVLLYVRGNPQILNHPSISIVGTRRLTLYGMQMAERIGRDLAARGLVMVSGLARGIDAIGHQGVLAASGLAIGVLGRHRRLLPQRK